MVYYHLKQVNNGLHFHMKIRKKIQYYNVFHEKIVKCEQFVFFNENEFAKKGKRHNFAHKE